MVGLNHAKVCGISQQERNCIQENSTCSGKFLPKQVRFGMLKILADVCQF